MQRSAKRCFGWLGAARRLIIGAAALAGLGTGAAQAQTCPATQQQASTQITATEKQQILDLVNQARRDVSPAATTPLPALVWNDRLAGEAQFYVNRMTGQGVDGHDPCFWAGWTNNGGAGENLAADYQRNVARMTQAWIDEKIDNFKYDLFPDTNVATPERRDANGNVTRLAVEGSGHYLQLVWHTATSIGCGVGSRPNRTVAGATEWLLICRTNPGGNRCHEYPWPSAQAVLTPGRRATGPSLGSCATQVPPPTVYGAVVSNGVGTGGGTTNAVPAQLLVFPEGHKAIGCRAQQGMTDQQGVLHAINCARRLNGNLPPLEWSTALADQAQSSANGRNPDPNANTDAAAPGATEIVAVSHNEPSAIDAANLLYYQLVDENKQELRGVLGNTLTQVGCGWAERVDTASWLPTGKTWHRRVLVCRYR